MRLKSVQIENYRSIENSGTFEVGDITCLVGKNEAGKSALLTALHQLRPYGEPEKAYDRIIDYPRRFQAEYADRHEDDEARVCTSRWTLTAKEKAALTEEFGEETVTGDTVTITKHYNETSPRWTLPIDSKAALSNLIKLHRLDVVDSAPVRDAANPAQAAKALEALPNRTDKQAALLEKIKTYPHHSPASKARAILDKTTPKFKLFSHFDRMSGQISIEQILQDKANGTLTRGDSIFLQFLEYAGTDLEGLAKAERYEELKSTCEAASNRLTDQIFEYWSQNTALQVEVDVSPGRAGDPTPFNHGTVVRARVRNTNHRASVPFSERSAGFVWFFSFLVEFTQIRKELGNVIILLDEPGLTLHGKAQKDLLRYFDEKLKPFHQVIFTTHSPFLIPADNLQSVRIVEDVIENRPSGRPLILGTKVREDALATDRDTLFPLQGALGYDIAQSLFIGENTLLVEGPSDILFLKAASRYIRSKGRHHLSEQWVICPSGGIDKIQPFVSLFGGNGINVAVLTDQGDGDKKKVETLRKSQILKSGQFFTTSDFLDQDTSDVEDILGRDAYIELVNATYNGQSGLPLDDEKLASAMPQSERIVKLVENAFKLLPDEVEFDHFSPASWLIGDPSFAEKLFDKHPTAADRFEAVFREFNAMLS